LLSLNVQPGHDLLLELLKLLLSLLLLMLV